MKLKDFKGIKGIIILIILIGLIVGYYFYLSNRNKPSEPEEISAEVMSVAEEVLARNLETNYPPTPREVVKYFAQISQCFYNEEYTEKELEKLAFQIRELYDDALIENQAEEDYLKKLKEDIDEFAEKKFTISSFKPSSAIDVETYHEDGFEWARLHCIFAIKQNSVLYNSDTVFLLRKDENGHWKIYGWELSEDKKNE